MSKLYLIVYYLIPSGFGWNRYRSRRCLYRIEEEKTNKTLKYWAKAAKLTSENNNSCPRN